MPVPAADGPVLAPVAMAVPVRAKPATDGEIIGVLRVGARVARSAAPVTQRDCAGGWYAVRPLGFVCVGNDVTLKLDHPIARAFDAEPDRAKPLPYRYAFLRAVAPNYMRIPNKDEQFRFEMRLERHLKNWKKFREKWDALELGANDVPLDESGLASGGFAPNARPMDERERFAARGDDHVPWWLEGERRIPNIANFKVPAYAVISNRIKRHGGVALIGSFVAPESAQSRRFAITTDGRLLPTDKLKADPGSAFHGYDIRNVGLPVAFVRALEANAFRTENNRFLETKGPEFRSLVALTGNVRVQGGERFVETRDGRWLESDQLGTVTKPSGLPGWVKKTTKWIDISLANQPLTLCEGDRPVSGAE